MEEYNTSEVPVLGQLIKGLLELTKAGVLKWRNHVDKDCATLRLNITGQLRSPKYNRGAVAVQVGGNYTLEGQDTGVRMPNYSVLLVAGDEAEELNVVLRTYPVDTDETDVAAAWTNDALANEQTS